jgi:hypothetical protein
MGKALSFSLAVVDLGLLVLFILSRHGNTLQDAGLLIGFLVLSGLTWFVALVSSIYRALTYRGRWNWVLALLALVWLPVLPALCFGASGMLVLFSRPSRRRGTKASGARTATVTVAAKRPTTPKTWTELIAQRQAERQARGIARRTIAFPWQRTKHREARA